MMRIADELGMYANDKPEEIISRDRGRKAAEWIQRSKIKGERDMLSVKTKNGHEFINIFTSATIDDWTYLIDQDDKAVAKLNKKRGPGQPHQFLGSLDLCGFEALSNIHLIWSKNALQASKINAW